MFQFPVVESLVWAVRYDFYDYDDLAKNNQSFYDLFFFYFIFFHPGRPRNNISVDMVKIYILACSDTRHIGDLSLESMFH